MISWIAKSSGTEAVAGLGTLIFVGLFAASPIALILVNSFNIASPGHPFRGGLQGWSDAFADGKTLSAVGYSFLLSIRSFVGVAIAFAVSWLLVRIRGTYPIVLAAVQSMIERYRKEGFPLVRVFPKDGPGSLLGGFSTVAMLKTRSIPTPRLCFSTGSRPKTGRKSCRARFWNPAGALMSRLV